MLGKDPTRIQNWDNISNLNEGAIDQLIKDFCRIFVDFSLAKETKLRPTLTDSEKREIFANAHFFELHIGKDISFLKRRMKVEDLLIASSFSDIEDIVNALFYALKDVSVFTDLNSWIFSDIKTGVFSKDYDNPEMSLYGNMVIEKRSSEEIIENGKFNKASITIRKLHTSRKYLLSIYLIP